MGVVQRCEQLCFTTKPRDAIVILDETLRQALERDITRELRVACSIDFAHRAGSES